MGRAIVEVTSDLLGEALHLRKGVRITGARSHPIHDWIQFKVEGDGLPETVEGEYLQTVSWQTVLDAEQKNGKLY